LVNYLFIVRDHAIHRDVRAASVCFVVILVGFWSDPAAAYVDPTAGGFVLQMLSPLMAVVVAGAVMLRDRIVRVWHAVWRMVARPHPGD